MPGFNDGLNMISKRQKRFKTNSKGYALKDLKDKFVIDNDGKYMRNRSLLLDLSILKCCLGI